MVRNDWASWGGDGYGWLLERCGDSQLSAHAAHLDDEELDPDCFYCPTTEETL